MKLFYQKDYVTETGIDFFLPDSIAASPEISNKILSFVVIRLRATGQFRRYNFIITPKLC